MEKRWNVYHGNDYLGLKTAKEIREALRQGTLDPFDKVSHEGSNIREDLIEVDEIFRETADAPQPSYPEAAQEDDFQHTMVAQRAPVRVQASPAPAPAKKIVPQNDDYDDQEYDAIEDFSARNETGARNAMKRYYLIDREKILGPISALEIQSLFNRNMLNKKVRVQKIGSEKTLPIAQFIASYSGDRLKELAEDGRIPQQIGVGSPSSKVMNELARMANSRRVAQDRKNRVYLIMALVGLVLGAGVYLLYEQDQISRRHEDKQTTRSNDAGEEREVPHAPKPTRITRPVLIQKAPEPPKVEVPEKPQVKPEKVVREVPIKIPTPSKPVEPKPVKKRNTEPSSVTRAAQSTSPARTTDIIPQGPGPIAKAIEAAGRIQTVGPLTFSISALEACTSKCNLTLRDATGATLKAVFFKNAYTEQLRSRAKGVFLTGNTKIDRGELTIFIQDVR